MQSKNKDIFCLKSYEIECGDRLKMFVYKESYIQQKRPLPLRIEQHLKESGIYVGTRAKNCEPLRTRRLTGIGINSYIRPGITGGRPIDI